MPYSASVVDTSGCVWDYLLGKSAFDACLTAANQNQIQSVVQNAQAAGYSPAVIAVAQQMATQQEAQVPADTQNTDTFYNLPASPFIPSAGPGTNWADPTTWPAWAWMALALGGGLIVVKLVR